jgi:hypothetical protein
MHGGRGVRRQQPVDCVIRGVGAINFGRIVALLIVDEHGIFDWSYRPPIAVNPGADAIPETPSTGTGMMARRCG